MKIWFWTEQMGRCQDRMGSPCRCVTRKKDLHPSDFYCLERMEPEMVERMGLEFVEREADKIIKHKIEQFIKDEVPKKIESLRQERAEIERMIKIADSMAPSAVRALKNVIADLDQHISDLEWYLPL